MMSFLQFFYIKHDFINDISANFMFIPFYSRKSYIFTPCVE